MRTTAGSAAVQLDARRTTLGKVLDDVGWGLLLLMTGGIWLLPAERVPPGAWLIGAGLIVVTLHVVRYLNGLRVNLLITALGVLALAGGLAEMSGMQLPLLAICLVVLGAALVLRPLVRPAR